MSNPPERDSGPGGSQPRYGPYDAVTLRVRGAALPPGADEFLSSRALLSGTKPTRPGSTRSLARADLLPARAGITGPAAAERFPYDVPPCSARCGRMFTNATTAAAAATGVLTAESGPATRESPEAPYIPLWYATQQACLDPETSYDDIMAGLNETEQSVVKLLPQHAALMTQMTPLLQLIDRLVEAAAGGLLGELQLCAHQATSTWYEMACRIGSCVDRHIATVDHVEVASVPRGCPARAPYHGDRRRYKYVRCHFVLDETAIQMMHLYVVFCVEADADVSVWFSDASRMLETLDAEKPKGDVEPPRWWQNPCQLYALTYGPDDRDVPMMDG
jgi:hypothetical protein